MCVCRGDILGAQRLEEGALAHKALLVVEELERDLALGLHVDGELDHVETPHLGRLLELVTALVQVGRRVLALADAAHRRDGREQLHHTRYRTQDESEHRRPSGKVRVGAGRVRTFFLGPSAAMPISLKSSALSSTSVSKSTS